MAFGIDLVEIDRFARALQRWPRLRERVFAPDEDVSLTPARLAGRFAAKEAAFKALGDGWPAIPYGDVRVVRGARGKPELELRGTAARAAAGRIPALSITHAGGFAVAGVVLTGGG